jgi:hypothetical protein
MDSASLDSLGIFGFILGVFAFIWCVLMFFAPFFWYGAWYRAKEVDKKLEETNRLLRAIASKA